MTASNRIPFQPALDGLRGLLLLAVLCFHSEFSWAKGGFLALPTFFTLSGYLITSLFLVEWERTERIALWRFWGRRFRRLMPALLVTLAAMSLYGALLATPDQLERLRGDVLWSLFYLANWHFVVTSTSYMELFAAPSPVQHFWSLAVEEQFYFAYPVLAVCALRGGSGSRAVLAGVAAALVAASVATSVALSAAGASPDRIYYGSDTRASEIFLGALVAILPWRRERPGSSWRFSVQALGAAALVGMLLSWSWVDIDAPWLYRGGFAAYSLLSLAVIAAATQPEGPVRRLLSGRALRWLGRVSYGAYLFHWPIFLWLSPERTGLEPLSLLALRTTVTLLLAGVSYRFLESPIRSGRVLVGRRTFVVTPLAFAAVALLITSVSAAPQRGGVAVGEEARLEEYAEELKRRIEGDALFASDPPSRTREAPRIAFFGDSTAVVLEASLLYDLESTGRARPSPGLAELGCGIMRDGLLRWRRREASRPKRCEDDDAAWRERIARARPDMAVVSVGPWDVTDRKLPGDERWRHVGDPVLDAYLRKEMLWAVDTLSSDGALVVWITSPVIEIRKKGTGRPPDPPFAASDPARMARFNEMIFELPERRPGRVVVIDLAAHMLTRPYGPFDPDYRPDGVHLSLLGALRVSREWLGDELLRVYREQADRDPGAFPEPDGGIPAPLRPSGGAAPGDLYFHSDVPAQPRSSRL
jgi:peptidoglycan/LPS O-acetylase OafA/YrhL